MKNLGKVSFYFGLCVSMCVCLYVINSLDVLICTVLCSFRM